MVRLSFAGGNFATPGYLPKNVIAQLDGIERQRSIRGRYDTAADRFRDLLETLHRETGQRAAVLVDEYDKPILDALEKPELARANRDELSGVYGVIKDADAHVCFTFLTGVSKFSKVNLFSGLNNLTDLTLDPRYAAICGYTDEDLDRVFAAELPGLDREQIRDWYNGYNWRGSERVYNPYDVLRLFRSREFDAHWFETGSPAFLVKTLFERRVTSVSLGETVSTAELLSAFDVGGRSAAEHIGTEALLFQTGYLTIDTEERRAGRTVYRLGYPNREVRQSLNDHLLRHLVRDTSRQTANSIRLYDLLEANDFDGMQALFQAFSPVFPTNGTRTTTSRSTRATTRACSSATSRPWDMRDGAGGQCAGAASEPGLRGQVPPPGRADPPGGGGVQPRHAQRDRVRGGAGLTRLDRRGIGSRRVARWVHVVREPRNPTHPPLGRTLPRLFLGTREFLAGDMPSDIRCKCSLQRLTMIGREEADLHVVIDDPLQRHPPGRDPERVADLFGDDDLALVSHYVWHGMTPRPQYKLARGRASPPASRFQGVAATVAPAMRKLSRPTKRYVSSSTTPAAGSAARPGTRCGWRTTRRGTESSPST